MESFALAFCHAFEHPEHIKNMGRPTTNRGSGISQYSSASQPHSPTYVQRMSGFCGFAQICGRY